MSQPSPFDEIKFEKDFCFKKILNTPDDKEICHFLEVDLTYLFEIRQKTNHFPFSPENKSLSKDDFNEYMKNKKPKNYVSHKKVICD